MRGPKKEFPQLQLLGLIAQRIILFTLMAFCLAMLILIIAEATKPKVDPLPVTPEESTVFDRAQKYD